MSAVNLAGLHVRPTKQHQGNKKIGLQARDLVWDTDDAAAHEVNLPANGKQVIKKLIVAAGSEIVERTYTVMLTKEHLTQVIYTTKRRVSPEGCTTIGSGTVATWNSCQ